MDSDNKLRKSKGNFGVEIPLPKIKLFKDLYPSYSFKTAYSEMLGTGEIRWPVLVEDLIQFLAPVLCGSQPPGMPGRSNTLFRAPKAPASRGHKPFCLTQNQI